MEVSPPTDGRSSSTKVCHQCGVDAIEPRFELPLCAPCRTRLARRPFPAWIKISGAIVLGALVIAGTRSEDSSRAGIAFDRGMRAEQQRDFAHAASYYQQVAERFPASTLALARLSIVRYRAGQWAEAARVIQLLGGRKIPRKLAEKLNPIIHKLRRRNYLPSSTT